MKTLCLIFILLSHSLYADDFQKSDKKGLELMCDYVKDKFESEKAHKNCMKNHEAWDIYSDSGELLKTYLLEKGKKPSKNMFNVSYCQEQSLDGDFSCYGKMKKKDYWIK